MRHWSSLSWVLVSFALITAGCGANLAPVLEVRSEPVTLPSGTAPTAPAVRDAIVRALAHRGWTVVSEQGPAITARVQAMGHWAIARIDYTGSAYSITRVDSSPGLKFDGERIHRHYNHWIDRLRASIAEELAIPSRDAHAPR